MSAKKPLLLFLIVPLLLFFYSCGGGGSGSSYNPPGETPGVPFVLTLTPSQGIANTNSSIILSAKVLDGNGVPVPGVPVTFTNLSEPFGVIKTALAKLRIIKSIGILSSTVANTNSLGIARVSISSTTVGFATVQAEVSNSVGVSRAKKTLFFALDLEPESPPPPTLTLHVDDGNGTFDQPADFTLFKTANDNQRIIRADVMQGSSVVVGAEVTFGADLPFRIGTDPTTACSDGSSTCPVTFPNGNTSLTNSAGQAFINVIVNPTIIGTVETVLNITGSTTVNNESAFNIVSLFLRPVNVDSTKSSISANPTVVATNETSAITAVVFLNTGAPVPDNTTVNFTATCGSVDPFGQTTNGVATAEFTAPSTPGTCTVEGKVAGVSIGTVDITVTTGLTIQPETQTISGACPTASPCGPATVTFTILGGIGPYTVTSDNTLFPPVLAADGKSFTVNVPMATKPVDVVYTVRDSAGTTAEGTLVITGPETLDIQATTWDIGTDVAGSITVQYFVSGGNAPYKVYFTYTGFIDAGSPTKNGDTVGAPGDVNAVFSVKYSWSTTVTSAKFQIIVVDSLGAFVSSDINMTGTAPTPTPTPSPTPTPAPLAAAPPAATICEDNLTCSAATDVAAFTITGGTPPYTVTSLTPSVIANPITVGGGGIFTVNATNGSIAVDTAVILTITDSAAGGTLVTVTVIAQP